MLLILVCFRMIYGCLQAPPLSPPQPINIANHAQTNLYKYPKIIICRYQECNEYYLNIIISIMTIMIYGCLQALPLSPPQPINIATSKSRQDKYLSSLYLFCLFICMCIPIRACLCPYQ